MRVITKARSTGTIISDQEVQLYTAAELLLRCSLRDRTSTSVTCLGRFLSETAIVFEASEPYIDRLVEAWFSIHERDPKAEGMLCLEAYLKCSRYGSARNMADIHRDLPITVRLLKLSGFAFKEVFAAALTVPTDVLAVLMDRAIQMYDPEQRLREMTETYLKARQSPPSITPFLL